jgi:hypothetical protein
MAGYDTSRQDVRLTELDPDLEEPLVVQKVHYESNVLRLNFTIEDERFSVLVGQGNTTCGEVKQVLTQILNIPSCYLSIRVGALPLNDTKHLSKLKSKYIVEVSHFERRFGVELVPKSGCAGGWPGKYCRQVNVDVGTVKRVGDLVGYLALHEGIGRIDKVIGISPFPSEKPLSLVPSEQTLISSIAHRKGKRITIFQHLMIQSCARNTLSKSLWSFPNLKRYYSSMVDRKSCSPARFRCGSGAWNCWTVIS